MTSASSTVAVPPSPRARGGTPLLLLLLALGMLGHLYAAHAMGGSRIAYVHHVVGFFVILAVTGVLLWLLGRWLWRAAHPARTLLVIAAVQAILGLAVALAPVSRIARGGG